MGLDMYFKIREDDYKDNLSFNESGKVKTDLPYPDDLKELGEYVDTIDFKSITTYKEYLVGYFRKFNALHSYIMKRFADNVNSCGPVYLYKNEIKEILDTLIKVQNDHQHACDILPTCEGFFFGSIDFDDYYFDCVDEAVKFFKLVLDKVDFSKYSLVYYPSW